MSGTAASTRTPTACRRRSCTGKPSRGRTRSQRLLNLERERTQFYADQCGGIQFDYDLLSGRVTVTNHYASAAERTQMLDFDHGEGLNFLSLKDRRRLLEALEKATPEIPQASFPVEVQTGGGYQPHRLVLRTQWSRGGQRRCVSVAGQLLPEQTEDAKAQPGCAAAQLRRLDGGCPAAAAGRV